MNLRKTIKRYADAVSYFDHFAGHEAISAEARKELAALQDRIDALIAQAEAAVRFADAAARCPGWEAVDEGHGKELMELVGAYEAAREAVRKLEGQADGS